MNDYIDRQAAIDSIEKHIRTGDELYPITSTDKILNHAFEIAASCVYNQPAADVAPVRHGRWEMKPDPFGFFHDIPVCPECGCTTKMRDKSAYCPHCGAKMDGGEDDKQA